MSMPNLDEEIARRLQEALESGELKSAPSYGKPLATPEGWDDTPDALRMAFKILKESGFAPPEVELFHERARLRKEIAACGDESERERLLRELSSLEQKISLRLESLRSNAQL
jgi:hypothetical protein